MVLGGELRVMVTLSDITQQRHHKLVAAGSGQQARVQDVGCEAVQQAEDDTNALLLMTTATESVACCI